MQCRSQDTDSLLTRRRPPLFWLAGAGRRFFCDHTTMSTFERIADSALAAVTGGAAPKRMQLELGVAGLRRIITGAGGTPPPPYVPRAPKTASPHPFTWSVGFIGKGPYG